MVYKDNRRGKKIIIIILSSKNNGLPNSLVRLAIGILDSSIKKNLNSFFFVPLW